MVEEIKDDVVWDAKFPPWQYVDTAPEGVTLLCYAEWKDCWEQIYTDHFVWMEKVVATTESITTHKQGRRLVIQETTVRYREWRSGCAPDKWMVCPPLPNIHDFKIGDVVNVSRTNLYHRPGKVLRISQDLIKVEWPDGSIGDWPPSQLRHVE